MNGYLEKANVCLYIIMYKSSLLECKCFNLCSLRLNFFNFYHIWRIPYIFAIWREIPTSWIINNFWTTYPILTRFLPKCIISSVDVNMLMYFLELNRIMREIWNFSAKRVYINYDLENDHTHSANQCSVF